MDGFAKVVGLNTEIGLALLAYAVGEYGSEEERESVLAEIKQVAATAAFIYVLGIFGAAVSGPGAPAVLAGAIAASKAVIRGLFRTLGKYIRKVPWIAKKLDDKAFASCKKLIEIMAVRGKKTVEVAADFGWKGQDVTKAVSSFTKEQLTRMGYDKRFLQEMAKFYRTAPGNHMESFKNRATQLEGLAGLFG